MHPGLERLHKAYWNTKRFFTQEEPWMPSRREAIKVMAGTMVVAPSMVMPDTKRDPPPGDQELDKIKNHRIKRGNDKITGEVIVNLDDDFLYTDNLYGLCYDLGTKAGVLQKKELDDQDWEFIYGCRDALVTTDQPMVGNPMDGRWEPKSVMHFDIDENEMFVVNYGKGKTAKIPLREVLKVINDTAISKQFDTDGSMDDVSWLFWRNCATMFAVGSLTIAGVKFAYEQIKAAEERELASLQEQGYVLAPQQPPTQGSYDEENFDEDEDWDED